MVVPVVAGPPQRTLLGGGGAAEGHQELHRSAHPVAAVGEIAVVARGDEEHADGVEDPAQHEGTSGHAGEDGGQARQMHEEERDGRRPVQTLVRAPYVGDGHSPTLPGSDPPYLPVGRWQGSRSLGPNKCARIRRVWTREPCSRCRGWWHSWLCLASAVGRIGSTGSSARSTPFTAAPSACGCSAGTRTSSPPCARRTWGTTKTRPTCRCSHPVS